MTISTSGRKVTLSQSFIDAIDKRMTKFDKYFENDAQATVTISAEGNRLTAEVTVRYRGFIYRAEKTETDMLAAFGNAADLIDRQITKNKSKLSNRIKKQEHESEDGYSNYEDFVDEEYRVVKEKQFRLKPMSTKEAILQMNMLGHNFFVFLNEDTNTVSVVYLRKDDDYGLITPEY